MTSLRDELEAALLDALIGDPWGPPLEGRLRTITRSILHRHRHDDAQINITDGPRGIEVRITLPTGPDRVRQLQLTLA